MEFGFSEALLTIGALLFVAAALSGTMRGTVLSISVLSVGLGIVLAALGVVAIEVEDAGVVELITLALILTLFADGLLVEREFLRLHWSPPVRAIAIAMPVTLGVLALAAKALFGALSWPEAFLLAAVLTPTDPVVTSMVVTARRVPALVRHTLNLESGLNDGLALPFVLFFIVLSQPGGDAGSEALELLGEAAFGAAIGIALGFAAGRIHRARLGGGVTSHYEGIYALGLGLLAYGLAEISFGNGLIAAFVAGITLAAAEHEIPDSFAEFAENISAISQVLTFFVFGALIVAVGYDFELWPLLVFIPVAFLVARPVALLPALARTALPRSQKLFMAWFGPKGVASMLFALYVLDSQIGERNLIFQVAAFTILASIVAHGLTDTVGARWIERRAARPHG